MLMSRLEETKNPGENDDDEEAKAERSKYINTTLFFQP